MKKFLVAAVAAFVLAGCGDSPEDVAKKWAEAAFNDKPKVVAELTYGLSEKDMKDVETMTKMLFSAANAQGGVDKFEVTKTEVHGDKANVWMRTTWKNGKVEGGRGPMLLQKDKDGKWKVISK